jgi:hypothetical protein
VKADLCAQDKDGQANYRGGLGAYSASAAFHPEGLPSADGMVAVLLYGVSMHVC